MLRILQLVVLSLIQLKHFSYLVNFFNVFLVLTSEIFGDFTAEDKFPEKIMWEKCQWPSPSLQSSCCSSQQWCCVKKWVFPVFCGLFFFPIKWITMEEHGEILNLQNYFMELLGLHGKGAFRVCLIEWFKYSSPNFIALTMNLLTDQTPGLNYIKQQR